MTDKLSIEDVLSPIIRLWPVVVLLAVISIQAGRVMEQVSRIVENDLRQDERLHEHGDRIKGLENLRSAVDKWGRPDKVCGHSRTLAEVRYDPIQHNCQTGTCNILLLPGKADSGLLAGVLCLGRGPPLGHRGVGA